ncbi:YggS family pyridoxal phosphate-dependent enzyme [Candidatus Marinamargulisbacteria bacterium SCGC AG-439-L15]|nr:YggS family pyridoxal phosphate-dependent enzyme [Candidatus Marinamargulisbacteria bacterium SCGC AG-439-L15]
MSTIERNLRTLESEVKTLSEGRRPVDILCVSKKASVDQIKTLVELGISSFGENKVQSTLEKIQSLNNPNINWHMIGHLQSNKVKKAVSIFDCIQSVDSLKLLKKINHHAKELEKQQVVLLQVNLQENPEQSGFYKAALLSELDEIFSFPNCLIKGIMTMAPNTEDVTVLSQFFKQARELFNELQNKYSTLETLSMGMSQDYKIAIQEGSTMIRVGSLLLRS